MFYMYTILMIGLVILVHELGHLLTARLVSIPIKTFSLGFGPRLIGFECHGTDYRISLIPLGGYVETAFRTENEIYAVSLPRRIVFTLGGIAANIVFAFVMLCLYRLLNQDLPFWSAIGLAGENTLALTGVMITTLSSLVTAGNDLSGIIGIVRDGGVFIAGGAFRMFSFAGVLSLNLAVINLLPLPVLDGGRTIFYIIERLFPPLRKLSTGLSIAGWIIILGLTIVATGHDLSRLTS